MKTLKFIILTLMLAAVCASEVSAQSKAKQIQRVVKKVIPKRPQNIEKIKKQVQRQVQEARVCSTCGGSGARTYVNQYGYYYNDYCNVCGGRGSVMVWVTKWVWE